MSRTALSIVEDYIEKVWHGQDLELVRAICANPIHRHDPGSVKPLTHEEQIARIGGAAHHQFSFTQIVLAADREYVTYIWNAVDNTGATPCGIEVFKVVDGRITDVWNGPYGAEHFV